MNLISWRAKGKHSSVCKVIEVGAKTITVYPVNMIAVVVVAVIFPFNNRRWLDTYINFP